MMVGVALNSRRCDFACSAWATTGDVWRKGAVNRAHPWVACALATRIRVPSGVT